MIRPSKRKKKTRREYKKGDEKSQIYKKWRTKIYKRDKYTCRLCRAQNVYLNAHHIKRKAWHPRLAYLKSNGITLCQKCHDVITGREVVFEKFFKGILRRNLRSKKGLLKIIEEFRGTFDRRWFRGVIDRLEES